MLKTLLLAFAGITIVEANLSCEQLKDEINGIKNEIVTRCGDKNDNCPSTTACSSKVADITQTKLQSLYSALATCSNYIDQGSLVNFIADRAAACHVLQYFNVEITRHDLKCLKAASRIFAACPRDCEEPDYRHNDKPEQNRLRRNELIDSFNPPDCQPFQREFGDKCAIPRCKQFFEEMTKEELHALAEDLRYCNHGEAPRDCMHNCQESLKLCQEDATCATLIEKHSDNEDYQAIPDDFLNPQYWALSYCHGYHCNGKDDVCWMTNCGQNAKDCFNDASCNAIANKAMTGTWFDLSPLDLENTMFQKFTECYGTECGDTGFCVLDKCHSEVEACKADSDCKDYMKDIDRFEDEQKTPSAKWFLNDKFQDLYICAHTSCNEKADVCWLTAPCEDKRTACLEDEKCEEIATKAIKDGDSLTDEEESNPKMAAFMKCMLPICEDCDGSGSESGSGSGNCNDDGDGDGDKSGDGDGDGDGPDEACMNEKCSAEISACNGDSSCKSVMDTLGQRDNDGPTAEELKNDNLFKLIGCSAECQKTQEGICWLNKCADEGMDCLNEGTCFDLLKQAMADSSKIPQNNNEKFSDLGDCIEQYCPDMGDGDRDRDEDVMNTVFAIAGLCAPNADLEIPDDLRCTYLTFKYGLDRFNRVCPKDCREKGEKVDESDKHLRECDEDEAEYGTACLDNRRECRDLIAGFDNDALRELAQYCPQYIRSAGELGGYINHIADSCCVQSGVMHTHKSDFENSNGETIPMPTSSPDEQCMMSTCQTEVNACMALDECKQMFDDDENNDVGPSDLKKTDDIDAAWGLIKCAQDGGCWSVGDKTDCSALPTLPPVGSFSNGDDDSGSGSGDDGFDDDSAMTVHAGLVTVIVFVVLQLLL